MFDFCRSEPGMDAGSPSPSAVYLLANPGGDGPDHGTGIACPVGPGLRVAGA